jgi:hypothetical protein
MKTTFIPPLLEIAPAKPTPLPLAKELTAAINHNARTLGTPGWDAAPLPGTPIIGSGHQAWFWHPGILIKDITAAELAKKCHGQAFHIVVDHDEHPACTLDVPVQTGRRITVKKLSLATEKPMLSSLDQPCINLAVALRNIDAFIAENPESASRLALLKTAIHNVHAQAHAGDITPQNLAHQITAILDCLRKSIGIQIPVLFASQLAQTSGFKALLDRFLEDPAACVQAYNAAVAKHPDAGIAPLQTVDPDEMIEAPFWIMRASPSSKPYPRVKAFVSRQANGQWAISDSKAAPVDPASSAILPRALTMTGLLRSQACHLFIHGKGGGQYDQITESWWKAWSGQDLSPKAVASADLYLPFNVPSATRKDVTKALWEHHSLPHNIDRAQPHGSPLAIEKGHILAQMTTSPDPAKRATLFHRLHEINHSLAAQSPDLIQASQQKLQDAQDGVNNAHALARRDWCFAFYTNEQLKSLSQVL